MPLKISNPTHKDDSSPFILEECDLEDKLLVTTKPSVNKCLPFPKDYEFTPFRLPKSFLKFGNQLRDFKVREDDVWVLSFPKSGTTWTQNIVWQLKNGLNTSRDPISLSDAQFLEWNLLEYGFDTAVNERLHSLYGNAMEKLNEAPSPRIIKSHLPPHLLPMELWTVRPKMIYICRNPKDVAVSMYHMFRNDFKDILGTMEEFFDVFMADKVWYGPYPAHIRSYWNIRHLDNFLFLTYEELSADRFKGLQKVSKFLRCAYSDEDLKKLSEYVSFGNMQKRNTFELMDTPDRDPKYRFFRRGKAGGFTDEMSIEYIEKFDNWTAERFRNSDFKFPI